MTTEEKAKRYDEALNWMRELYPGLHGATKEDAEHFFPELRESEDERIRKLLVWQVYRNIEDETNDLAQSVYDGIKGHDPDLEESIEDWKKCLAYLEKQKENPKSADSIPEYCASNARCPYKIYGDEDFIGDIKDTPAYHFGFDEGVRSEREKQKEQKPVQTSEEKQYIRTLMGLISDFIRDKQPEDVVFYQKIYDWLDGRHIEQEPNIELIQRSWYMEGYHDREFGKEPKWIIKTGEGGPRHEENPKYGQMLEAEQKPAEGKDYSSPECGTTAGVWSEEDEKMIDNLIRFFNEKLVILGEAENAENTVQYVSYKKVIDWLKSLRPSWKPSEGQMSMLLAVINDPNNAGAESCYMALKSIYNNLKKLM